MKITFECYYKGKGRRRSRIYEVEADESDVKEGFISLDSRVWEQFITFDMPINDDNDDWDMRIIKKEQ